MKNPQEVDWNYGPVPPVEEDRIIIIFTKEYCGVAFPWGNDMNPVRWCGGSFNPMWGYERPVGYWCYAEEFYPALKDISFVEKSVREKRNLGNQQRKKKKT